MAKNANIIAVLAKELPQIKFSFDAETVKEPGEYIPRGKAVSPPSIAYNATPGTTYLALNIDLDAPFISFPILGPIMHWMKPDLTSSDTKDEAGFAALTTKAGVETTGVKWGPPGPPPGAAPHRYVFLLYEQPEDFDATSMGWTQEIGRPKRMRFDLDGFEKKAGLGKAVAGGWFVSN